MAAAPPIDNCKATSWAAGYDYGSLPDGYLSASVKPSTTSAGAPNCLRYDKGVTLTIKRSSSAPDTNAEAIGAHGSFTYCFYTDCLFDENAESNVVAFIADYPSMPPPPCVMYSAAADSAATAHNIDPALLAAVAATESGNPRIDDGADIYQQGGPVPASGPCQNLCGVGPWQVDTAAHPGYTGGLDVTANANYAATVLAEAIHAAQNYLPASATLDQIYMAAGNYYNGGPNAMRGVYPTSAQTWNDGSQPYGVGLVRHYHRILDYKAVCENGTRG